jgi:hypothetical protein
MRAALFTVILIGIAALLPAGLSAAEKQRKRWEPSIGYVYPAGGCEGTVFQVLVGGQNLRGVIAAHVSGDDVRADVRRHVRALSNQQQRELARRIAAVKQARSDAERPKPKKRNRSRKEQKQKKPKQAQQQIELPDHPLFNDLEKLSDEELDQVFMRFLGAGRKKQINVQISETVEIEIEVAPGATPGYREIRLETRAGLSNPVRFQVGALPEVCEKETPAQPHAVHDMTSAGLPLLVNGQILPGDIDRFRLRASAGQRLVIAASARDLVPYLADAVPGWFQATLSVTSASGREVAFSDDYQFQPDPRLVLDVPADGEYVVEIRDSIYRGREDFVYRLAVAESTSGAWTPSRGESARAPELRARSAYPESAAVEPDDDAASAQALFPPRVVHGHIGWPGDEDFYVFQGSAGEDLVVEVEGRRLHSPIDPVVRVLDPSGEVIAWSDDFDDGEPSLLTHHADSYTRVRLPTDGAYTVHVTDVRGHGGALYSYRLRVGPPRPDFEVILTPSSLTLQPGRSIPFRVHAVRKDGFDGEIEIRLVDAPEGFLLRGNRVPAGRSSARMTLTAPGRAAKQPVALRLEGRAEIGEIEVLRSAVPADDRMQAFLYRHLVPAQELLVAVRGGRRRAPPAAAKTELPVVVPAEGTARVEFRVPGLREGMVLEPLLDDPPKGLSLRRWEVHDGELMLELAAAADAEPTSENLIVEVYAEFKDKKGKRHRVPAGYLPALPVEIGKR